MQPTHVQITLCKYAFIRRQHQVNRVKVEVGHLGHAPLACTALQGSEADFRGPYRLALAAVFSQSEYSFQAACTAPAVAARPAGC